MLPSRLPALSDLPLRPHPSEGTHCLAGFTDATLDPNPLVVNILRRPSDCLTVKYLIAFPLMTQQQEAAGRKRGRSPSYPAIGLQEALRLARLLYDREGRSPAPIEAVVTDWGLKPTSGYGWVVVAALIKFGLLTDEGKGPSRKAKLTNLALDIVLDQREDNGRRKELIREAALKPTIHADLWKKYGPTLPSDATLRFSPRKEKGI